MDHLLFHAIQTQTSSIARSFGPDTKERQYPRHDLLESKNNIHARESPRLESPPLESAVDHTAAARNTDASRFGPRRPVSAGGRGRIAPRPPDVRGRQRYRTANLQARSLMAGAGTDRRRVPSRAPRWAASRPTAIGCIRRDGSPSPPTADGAERGGSRWSCGTRWSNGFPTRRVRRRRGVPSWRRSSPVSPGPASTGFQEWRGCWD